MIRNYSLHLVGLYTELTLRSEWCTGRRSISYLIIQTHRYQFYDSFFNMLDLEQSMHRHKNQEKYEYLDTPLQKTYEAVTGSSNVPNVVLPHDIRSKSLKIDNFLPKQLKMIVFALKNKI